MFRSFFVLFVCFLFVFVVFFVFCFFVCLFVCCCCCCFLHSKEQIIIGIMKQLLPLPLPSTGRLPSGFAFGQYYLARVNKSSCYPHTRAIMAWCVLHEEEQETDNGLQYQSYAGQDSLLHLRGVHMLRQTSKRKRV